MTASKEKKKIPMEKYMDFVLSQKELDLKIDFLNQIINMHGFRRSTKTPKSMLIDAMKTLDLMSPSRSTVKENISPCASITLNDIIDDLNDLTWRECCVTSINVLTNTKTNTNTSHSQLSKCFAGNLRDSSASTSSYFGFENGEIATKSVTKRKRSST